MTGAQLRVKAATRAIMIMSSAAMLSACGSTVALSSGAPVSAQNLGGLGESQTATSAVLPNTSGISANAETQTPGAQLPGPQNQSGSISGVEAAGATSNRALNAKTLKLGIAYTSGSNEGLAALGFGALTIPSTKDLTTVLIRYINIHGGIAGRKIEPIWFEFKANSDAQSQTQAACEFWTRDNKVFAATGVSGGTGANDDIVPCLSARDVPWLWYAEGDASYWRQYHRWLYSTDAVNYTTGSATLIDALVDQGFFKGSHKLGLLQIDNVVLNKAIHDGMLPSLARHGLTLTSRIAVADDSSLPSASASAVLRFKAQGVDRVVFMAPGGGVPTYFMQSANSQNYNPTYGIWSADSPYVLALLAPKSQLMHSQAYGYRPLLDVASQQDPTAKTTAAKQCLAIFTKAGADTSGNSNSVERALCDTFFTLAAAATLRDHSLTSTAVLEQAFEALGASYPSAGTFATTFRPGRHDGGSAYHYLAFGSACGCFNYFGPSHRIS